jgi:hypothetical protein
VVSRATVVGLVSLVGFVTVVNRARASCPEPGPSEVVVFAEPGYGDPCFVLETGYYNYWEMGVADNTMSSIKVGSSVRARLYRDGNWTGPQAPFEGGYGAASLPYGSDDNTSSLVVEANNDTTAAVSYVSAYPSNSSNFWISNSDGQGLTHTTTDWILSAKTDLWRVPLSSDLAGSPPANSNHVTLPSAIPSALSAQGYGHFGDPDDLGQYIFIPIEAGDDANYGPQAIVAVFRASDLSYVSSNPLTAPQSDHHSAWVAVQQIGPSTAYLYTSNGTLTGDAGNQLQQYYIDLHGLFDQFLFYQGEITLYGPSEYGYPPVNLTAMQGGDVSPDGRLIYLSNSGADGDGPGVRVFDLSTGIMQAKSENNYGSFNFKFECCGATDQEAEGVDYFDLNGVGAPNMPANSQLHVMLFDNFPTDYWVMHYTF